MNAATGAAPSRLPHGVLASTVIGIAAAACGWLLNGLGPVVTVTSYLPTFGLYTFLLVPSGCTMVLTASF